MIELWALLVGIGAAVFAVGVSTIAILRCYFPPQTRAVQQLRAEVEELGDDNDRIHTRLNERAARANMEKARVTKDQRRSVTDEAAEVLREKIARAPDPQPNDIEATRAALRKRHLQ